MTATARDIALIVLAIESILVLFFLIVLIIQIHSLIILLQKEVKPLLQSTQETADTVRNTSKFVSQHVAQPFINMSSFAAGVRQASRSLKRKAKNARRTPKVVTLPEPNPVNDGEV